MKQELLIKLGYYLGSLLLVSVAIFGVRLILDGPSPELAAFLATFASISIGWGIAVWTNEWIGAKSMGAFVGYSAPIALILFICVQQLSDGLMPFLSATDAALGFWLTQMNYWSNIRPEVFRLRHIS